MKWRLSTIVATVTLCVCLGMIGLFWVSTPAIPAKDRLYVLRAESNPGRPQRTARGAGAARVQH